MPTLHPIDTTLPIGERLDAFVAQRASLLERVTGVRRAALLREHESESIAAWLTATRRAKAIEVERVFAEELEPAARGRARPCCARDGGRRVLDLLGELPHPAAARLRARMRRHAHARWPP